jgi:23S rRNA pseudouridine1911/1915/1917 synthase
MKGTPTILYEDNHLLVVAKPAMLSTQGVDAKSSSLVTQLKEYLRVKYKKHGNVFLGVVSRLDSWVSGVIVLARTSKAAERLNQQFRDRTCRKTYLCLVPDSSELAQTGILENWVLKHDASQRMVVLHGQRANCEGQLARLSYRTLAVHRGERLLAIELETGRKHQIRVQLSAAGCPILGDRKYGSHKSFPVGIALHSYRLEISHPTTKLPLNFKTEPPQYWNLDRFDVNWNEV